MKKILGLVTAAEVGAVLNLTIYLGKAMIFPVTFFLSGLEIISAIWVVISFVAIFRFKLNMILWIGISSLFGRVHYLVM